VVNKELCHINNLLKLLIIVCHFYQYIQNNKY